MTWSKPHVSWNKEHEALIDRCINCGQTKEVKTTITMEFGEDNFNTGPCCKDCYLVNYGPKIIQI